ncbi:TPA: hypothetical protein OMP85_003428 [Acinetobacter baumannii]|nr:hypothetical protein [Acinetobacter baumannii]
MSNIIFSPKLTNPSIPELQQRYVKQAKLADELEAQIYSDIRSYDWKLMGIQAKAVIDFMKLEFEPKTDIERSLIKKYLTEKTGTRFYIQESEFNLEKVGKKFTITIHDIKSGKQLSQIIGILSHYGVNRQLVKVVEAELALDFYNAPRKELLIALFKCLRLPQDARSIRVYRRKDETQKVPVDLIQMQKYLNDFYCIGINPRGSQRYYRLYNKVTDKKQSLPPEQHRLRLEVNLGRNELNKITPNLSDFKTIITEGFKHIDFTELGANADHLLRKKYWQQVRPYGKEVRPFRSRSGNKRVLPEGIKQNQSLNAIKRTSVSNLTRHFNHF